MRSLQAPGCERVMERLRANLPHRQLASCITDPLGRFGVAQPGLLRRLLATEARCAAAAHTWRLARGDRPVQSKRLADCAILCVAFCPNAHSSHHAAVGLASGSIAVVDVLTGNTVYRLPGHTSEVQTLSWYPYVYPGEGDPHAPPTPRSGGRRVFLRPSTLGASICDRKKLSQNLRTRSSPNPPPPEEAICSPTVSLSGSADPLLRPMNSGRVVTVAC